MLQRGQCEPALQQAERLYAAAAPNARAAVLAGQAAGCLQRSADQQRWFARALFELELGAEARGWTVAPSVESLSWLDASTLAIQSKTGSAELRDAARTGQWSFRPAGALPRPLGTEAPVVDLGTAGELIVRDGETNAPLWRREVSLPPSELHVSRSGDRIALLFREPNAVRIQYELLELKTGKIIRRGATEGDSVRNVVSSSFSPWLSFETTDAGGRGVVHVLVDEHGRVSRQREGEGCVPLAAWTQNTFLSDCGELALYAVDVRSRARRRLATKPLGGFVHVEALGERLASFSGTGGAFVLRGTNEGEASIVRAEVGQLDLSGGVRWSPDGTRFAAIGSADDHGRRVLLIWSLASGRVEARWVSYAQSWPGQTMGFALSRSRDRLVIGGCPELQLFELGSGAFSASPGVGCTPILAATSAARFVVIEQDGQVLSWQPPGVPVRVTGLKLERAAGGAVAAGDWLVVSRGEISWLVHLPSNQRLELPEQGQVRALSPDGAHVVYRTRREVAGKVELALVLARLDSQPPRVTERLRVPTGVKAQALFSRNGAELYFNAGQSQADGWRQLDIKTLAEREAEASRDLTGAVELSADGARVLRAASLVGADRGGSVPLPHVGDEREQLKPRGPLFAADDKLVVARRGGSALLWRTRDAALLGRLQPLAAGGALFTSAPPREGQDPTPETSLVQLFGAAEESLRCVVGDELHPWAVCADRYEGAGLLATALATATP